jgi:LuxR family transcriptional regulator, maltose regulon positive regulatory protein
VITRQFMGEPDQADETMRLAQEFTQWTKESEYLDIVHSCQARLALLRGDIDSASRWQRALRKMPGIPMMFFFLEIPAITECRVLIAIGSDASLKGAMERLENIYQKAKAWQNTCRKMEILALQALVSHRQGRLEVALETLTRAVAIAMPGGSIRPFVEPGLPMADMLKKLAEKDVAVDFIETILADFKVNETGSQSLPFPPSPHPPVSPSPIVDPLTNRELDVLELLAQRLRNKEIAEKLFISDGTVKGHLKNIYQKLNVSKRQQAVEKAKTLGILSRQ